MGTYLKPKWKSCFTLVEPQDGIKQCEKLHHIYLSSSITPLRACHLVHHPKNNTILTLEGLNVWVAFVAKKFLVYLINLTQKIIILPWPKHLGHVCDQEFLCGSSIGL